MVSDEDAEGHAVIRVAHEALLSRWPRARDIVNANRDFLETRARVQTDARRWHSDRKNPELLLPPGKRLAEAEELLLARRDEVDDRIVEYVEASSLAQKAVAEKELQAERARIEARKRPGENGWSARRSAEAWRPPRRESSRGARGSRRHRTLLAIGAGAGAVVGFRGQQEAIRQTERAEENASEAQAAATQAQAAETQALEAKDEALRNQSLSLSFLSQQTAASGDTEAAILLALEALPTEHVRTRPAVSVEAEAALYKALSRTGRQ